MNAPKHRGYDDWPMPDAKELQGLMDYSRSPDTTDSAAIDCLVATTRIINEAVQSDYPFYRTSTTHLGDKKSPGDRTVYVAFGRAMGRMDGTWGDAHGAGSHRSDPESGGAAAFATGRGLQGDAIRILNHVRPVWDVRP